MPRKTPHNSKRKDLTQNEYEILLRYVNRNSEEDIYGQIDRISIHFSQKEIKSFTSTPTEVYNWENLAEKPETAHSKITDIIPEVESELIMYLKAHPEYLYKLSSRKFEEIIAEIFRNQGFNVELTPETRDGGYDIIAIENSLLTGKNIYLVECKRYNTGNTVGIGIIQRMLGVVTQNKVTKGIIATTSLFTKDAIQSAESAKHLLELKNYYNILDWIKSYKI